MVLCLVVSLQLTIILLISAVTVGFSSKQDHHLSDILGMLTKKILSCTVLALTARTIKSFSPAAVNLSSSVSPNTNSKHPYSLSARSMSDEVEKAKEAAQLAADGSPPTIFDKIISGEWSSDKLYEDDKCMAFRDVNPQAPTHFLVIPKERDGLTQLSLAREDQKELLGHLMYVAKDLGKKECPDGFRIIINDGKDGAQSVYHLHLHVMGGRQLSWPPG
mmetsp:Transcript_26707/g.40378  ORF Transcript_26707/g.40378 Transcript_26707/m.40378 type:complete len:219 (+) Transcript_26707:318-974(+)